VLRQSEEGVDVQVAEVDKDGIRLTAGTWARSFTERAQLEAGLRASCLERLQRHGLSSTAGG
jgi:hypothetical protein